MSKKNRERTNIFRMGIYQIRNIINDDRYIGSTVNVDIRRGEHLNMLKKREHHSPKLQNACDKYGIENFVFEHIASVWKKEDLVPIENIFFTIYAEEGFLKPAYNSTLIAGSRLGTKFTQEQIKRLSDAHKGYIFSDERRAQLSELQKDKSFRPPSPVKQIDLKTGLVVKEYEKIKDAKQDGFHPGHISSVCSGKLKTHGGYRWEYIDPENIIKVSEYRSDEFKLKAAAKTASKNNINAQYNRPVVATNILTGEKKEYSAPCVAKVDGFQTNHILDACNGIYKQHKGYTWNFL